MKKIAPVASVITILSAGVLVATVLSETDLNVRKNRVIMGATLAIFFIASAVTILAEFEKK